MTLPYPRDRLYPPDNLLSRLQSCTNRGWPSRSSLRGRLLLWAQALTKCAVGQPVTDQEGKTGVIVSDNSNLCQVKYGDGQTYGWIFWNLRPAAEPTKSGSTAL